MPGLVCGGEGAPCHDIMDMGMVSESPSPSMEDAEEAWEIAPDMAGIFDERSDGI